ncbi:class I SAM-dependent methyltransferase [Bacillus sp. EAC]|uniref:class I SAM-dependent methyltransferase n=1 Tax=Bacillus sp. EAC TaxID=1978338 RepID=UPI000B454FB5|nr:class I SAM-dependent methyltransferase [Bacillus sp. EAC]
MNNQNSVETVFNYIDESTECLKDNLDISYLEALIETGENFFEGEILQEEINESQKERLMNTIQQFINTSKENESIRRAFQLAILKGMKQGVQTNHEMTPDGIAFIISYIVGKFTEGKKDLTILDPAIGTGNLLLTIMNASKDKFTESFGIDIDDVLVRIAFVIGNLLGHEIELFNQDSLAPLFIDPVDLVVCDLPIGYYPNDQRANDFKLKAKEGMSYAHHLFIEQSMNYLKSGGFFISLVPNHLFTSDQTQQLQSYINETGVIQGLIQLPVSAFKDEKHQKSILIIRKNAENMKKPKQALLVDFPKLSNMKAVEDIMLQMNEWFKENL